MGIFSSLFGKEAEISEHEQNIASLRMEIAANTDANVRRWLKQRLAEEQDALRRAKKK